MLSDEPAPPVPVTAPPPCATAVPPVPFATPPVLPSTPPVPVLVLPPVPGLLPPVLGPLPPLLLGGGVLLAEQAARLKIETKNSTVGYGLMGTELALVKKSVRDGSVCKRRTELRLVK